MIPLAQAALELAPHLSDIYRQSLELNQAAIVEKFQINTPLRAAHWLAQGLHETGGGTIVRESGAYSATRLVEVFGPGRSSAAVTQAEAAGLAYHGEAIFERVYGLGNPHLARVLGNTQAGDGWNFRGNCWFQTTGRDAHHRFGDKLGISFEAHPEMMATTKYAVMPAALEWDARSMNVSADRNDIRAITKALNGGYNGYASRVVWFGKAWALLKAPDHPADAWAHATPTQGTAQLQASLNQLGYKPALRIDGRFGPATEGAVEWFQKANGLLVDGIPGPATMATLGLRMASLGEAP